MSFGKCVAVLLLFTLSICCQGGSGEQKTTEASDIPQFKKIVLGEQSQADSLINLGLDVIVVEENYVVARIDEEAEAKIQALNLEIKPISESDLVQRLARIIVTKKTDASDLLDLGVDIWEVKGDTVLAQVFDKHIRQIEEKGYAIEIVERNVLDTLGKTSQK